LFQHKISEGARNRIKMSHMCAAALNINNQTSHKRLIA